jgi:hypothetical protein
MDDESHRFDHETETSRQLAELAAIKRHLKDDLTDLTYAQVRLLSESIGQAFRLQGVYRSYGFLGSPVVYGALSPAGVEGAPHVLPPDHYQLLEVMAEQAHDVLVLLSPESTPEVVYTVYADSLEEVPNRQLSGDEPAPLHPPRPPSGNAPLNGG